MKQTRQRKLIDLLACLRVLFLHHSIAFEPREEILSPVSSDDEDIRSFNQDIRHRATPFKKSQEEPEPSMVTQQKPQQGTPSFSQETPIAGKFKAVVPVPTALAPSSSQAKPAAPKATTAAAPVTPVKAAPASKQSEAVYKAIFDYSGKVFENDNLSFKKGDLIVVIGKEEDGWLRGHLKSAGASVTGLFPGTFVIKV